MPDITVVIPMPDHRGWAVKGLRSWLCDQTLPASRYEVIACTDEADPALDAELASLLRPGDQLLRLPGADLMALYDAGARAARAPTVVLTESHCAADPRCLEEVLRHFEHTGDDAACLASDGASMSVVARLEQRLFDEGFIEWSSDGHWRKVLLRGCAIRREAYEASGGFDVRYGRFADTALSLSLRRLSLRVGFARNAKVIHRNTTRLRDLPEPIVGSGAGEIVYRLDHVDDPGLDELIGWPSEWVRRGDLDAALARRSMAIAFRTLRSRSGLTDPRLAGGMIRVVVERALVAVAGPRSSLLRTRCSVALAALRVHAQRHDEEGRLNAFRDYWNGLARCGRLVSLAAHPRTVRPVAPVEEVLFGDLPDDRLAGFHAREQSPVDGRPFRWTGPVAVANLPLRRAGASFLHLDTGGLDADPGRPVSLHIGGARVDPTRISRTTDGFVVRLQDVPAADGDLRLDIACRPDPRPRGGGADVDRRVRGLPLVSARLA